MRNATAEELEGVKMMRVIDTYIKDILHVKPPFGGVLSDQEYLTLWRSGNEEYCTAVKVVYDGCITGGILPLEGEDDDLGELTEDDKEGLKIIHENDAACGLPRMKDADALRMWREGDAALKKKCKILHDNILCRPSNK